MSKYRHQQRLLFQPAPSASIPARLPGGAPLPFDLFGPTADYVDCAAGWPWDRKGGDWLGVDGVRYSQLPWFKVVTDTQAATPGAKDYQADVTGLVRFCQQRQRWLAVLLTTVAARTLGPRNSYKLSLVYQDGAQETLPAWCVAGVGGDTPNTAGPAPAPPLFLEFERPYKPVRQATLHFTVLQHWSGADTSIRGYLLDPPRGSMAARPVQPPRRSGQLLGRQDFLDGTQLADYVHPAPINHSDERSFDPAIWGGATDLTKLPHQGAGKWVLSSEDRGNWSLVPSAYTGEGFQPVAPGVGALRLTMPAVPGVEDGAVVGSSGSLAANGMLYLPEPLFGRLHRLFVRYYFRLGSPYGPQLSRRKNVRHALSGPPVWTTAAGKFGIGPDHSTSWGGVSGTSGGPYGWQMRGSWYDCDAGLGGPDEGGIAVGHHLYDYLGNNPPGHRYGQEQSMRERWGQQGGFGGILYAGHWYCIETELRLNDLGAQNGELRTWIDGRLAYDRRGMVFRTGPVFQTPPSPGTLRPARELGIRGIWLNWFHGGKTLNTYDRTAFYTKIAYGTEYIGP